MKKKVWIEAFVWLFLIGGTITLINFLNETVASDVLRSFLVASIVLGWAMYILRVLIVQHNRNIAEYERLTGYQWDGDWIDLSDEIKHIKEIRKGVKNDE